MKKICKRLSLISMLAILAACNQSSQSAQGIANTLRIATNVDPATLDPRKSRNLENNTLLHHLFEGLMRINFKGKPVPALAEKVEISDDLATYTFKLRKSSWSNGDPLTAQDIEETWKSVLDPEFPAPNAYQLFVIKGAKAAKEGKFPLNEIGVHAVDDSTLVVELEKPTPYFLELAATHFYYPVHRGLRENPTSEIPLISNGPYMLKKREFNSEIMLVKNPTYYDAEEVFIETLIFIVLDENTSLQMFETGGLDWTGSPVSVIPPDAMAALKKEKQLKVAPGAGTHWFRLNTERVPFNNVHMRRAFALALNRKDIVEHVTQGNQMPAMDILPPSMALQSEPFYQDNDMPAAWENFQKGLDELNISKDDIPPLILCYTASDRNRKIAQTVQQQWQKAFGVPIELESCESKVQFDKLARKDYQISIGSWFADISDPINFLEVFKYKDNGTNNTQWENSRYIELLNLSSNEKDPAKRKHILHEAEELLMKEMPVIPLFYSSFNYVANDQLMGYYFSELGYIDFKEAFLEDMQMEDTLD